MLSPLLNSSTFDENTATYGRFLTLNSWRRCLRLTQNVERPVKWTFFHVRTMTNALDIRSNLWVFLHQTNSEPVALSKASTTYPFKSITLAHHCITKRLNELLALLLGYPLIILLNSLQLKQLLVVIFLNLIPTSLLKSNMTHNE